MTRTILGSKIALVLASVSAVSAVACSQADEKKAAWSCEEVAVPMGSTVRCVQSALTQDGPTSSDPLGSTTPVATGAIGATADGANAPSEALYVGTTPVDASRFVAYRCAAGAASADCPPSDTSVYPSGGTSDGPTEGTGTGTGSGSGTTEDGAQAGGAGSGTGASSGEAGTGTGTSSGGTGTGGTVDGPGSGGSNGGGNASSGGAGGGGGDGAVGTTGDYAPGGPTECRWVPDLSYCGGTSDGGNGTGSGTGSDCTSPGNKCGSNGAGNGNGASGGASSSRGAVGHTTDGPGGASSGGSSGSSGATSSGATSSGAGTGGGGVPWVCAKDAATGERVCEREVPSCAPGTHASSCGACVPDGAPEASCEAPSTGGCWVTGGGFVTPEDGKDTFGGNAMGMKKGTIRGEWNHVDHGTQNHAHLEVEYLVCRKTSGPGPKQPGGKKGFEMNQAYFGGPARWRDAATATWGEGYWADVVVEDHGEPGNTSAMKGKGGVEMADYYHLTVRKQVDVASRVSGSIVYETRGDLVGGNIQLHSPNGGHPDVSSALPPWVSVEE